MGESGRQGLPRAAIEYLFTNRLPPSASAPSAVRSFPSKNALDRRTTLALNHIADSYARSRIRRDGSAAASQSLKLKDAA